MMQVIWDKNELFKNTFRSKLILNLKRLIMDSISQISYNFLLESLGAKKTAFICAATTV